MVRLLYSSIAVYILEHTEATCASHSPGNDASLCRECRKCVADRFTGASFKQRAGVPHSK